jgi:hypothetical protein
MEAAFYRKMSICHALINTPTGSCEGCSVWFVLSDADDKRRVKNAAVTTKLMKSLFLSIFSGLTEGLN